MKRKKPIIADVAFDNPFGRLAEELDPYCEGAKVGVMVTLMSAFSGHIGHEVGVHTGRGSNPLSLWFVLVGHSGKGRKGATARIVLPVVKKAFKKWSEHHIVYGIPATGLGMMSELAEHEGSPVFVLEEEGDGFVANSKKDTKVGEKLRKAWDGEDLTHKTSKADISVKAPHLGFVMHIQPRNWGAIAGSRDATGGTWNRFLAVWVEQSKRVKVFGGPDPTEAIKGVSKALRGMASWAVSTQTVKVPDNVAERFEEYHRPVCESFTEENEELSQMAERALAYLIRISALYALADNREEVCIRDMDSALELIRYSVESVRYVLPEVGGSSLAGRLLDAVQDGPKTKTEIWAIIGRSKYTARDFDEAVRQLPQLLVAKLKSSGGRKPEVLFLPEDAEQVKSEFDVEDDIEDIVRRLSDSSGVEGEGAEAEEVQAVSSKADTAEDGSEPAEVSAA